MSENEFTNRIYPIKLISDYNSNLLEFECENGHKFKSDKNRLLERIKENNDRKSCPYCLTKRQLNLIEFLESYGIKIVNISDYKTRDSLIEFKCKHNNLHNDKPKNIKERIVRGSNICRCE